MTKSELIDKMAGVTGLTKTDTAKAVNAFIDCVTSTLKKGQKITIMGFGTFAVSKRKARTGRDPRTGEQISIPAVKIPRFTAGKGLKQSIK
jgi:DNA-binding protein HU-beta